MRDIEQIEEVEGEAYDVASRKLATLLMAALVTVGLVFAMGVLLGRTADAEDPAAEDPLAALAQLSAHTPDDGAPLDVPPVDRESLTFPDSLGAYAHRPEVVAAIAAAAAELEHPEPLLEAPSPMTQVPAENLALPTSLPAAVAAGPGSVRLAQLRAEDPLVQDALPEEPAREKAPEGHDGLFTLQVASFQHSADADALANALRARSHRAFVTRVELPERGTYWRVRIGPFETQRDVNSYRASFEAEEQMDSYIVRRPS